MDQFSYNMKSRLNNLPKSGDVRFFKGLSTLYVCCIVVESMFIAKDKIYDVYIIK